MTPEQIDDMAKLDPVKNGFWRMKFDNGYFDLEMPLVLKPDEVECFDEFMDLIKRQIHRWSESNREKEE